MDAVRSDALVFFGATGDLAYKKIFPALQAMVRRGNLDTPVIGIAREGWSLERLRERARASVAEHGGGVDPAAFAKLAVAAPLRRGRLHRPRDLRPAEAGARRRDAPHALSRDRAEPLPDGGRGARPLQLRERRAGRAGEAIRPRPRVRARR